MAFTFQLFGLLVSLLVCSFCPGYFFVRRLRWRPLETLCGSIGLSLILLYLTSFFSYWIAQPGDLTWSIAAWSVLMICILMGLVAVRDFTRLLVCGPVRRILFAFFVLWVWTLSVLCVIRNYSGGAWSGDWLEHFQRSLFFLHRFPEWTPIFPHYELPARPPMMNLLGALFLAQTGDGFALFQIVFAFLNLLVFLPCSLLTIGLAKGNRRPIVVLVVLFALNPLIVENVTYTWTKLFAGFYVLLGLWFYLAAWRKSDRKRMVAAFVAFSAATLAHYSAGPYVLAVLVHYALFVMWRRKEKWRELLTVAAASGILLVPWFAWSTSVYGPKLTVTSNTTVNAALVPGHSVLGDAGEKFATNFSRTLVPHPLLRTWALLSFPQSSAIGNLRDYTFLIYQTNVIFALGLVGGPTVVCLLVLIFGKQRRVQSQPQRAFWLMFLPFCLAVGIAVHPTADLYGVAHVTLQPLIVLGLSLLAGKVHSLRRVAASAILLGCAADFAIGVLPQLAAQSLENGRDKTVFMEPDLPNHRLVRVNVAVTPVLSGAAWENWFRKHELALSDQWMRELEPFSGPSVDKARLKIEAFRREDDFYWHGWYGRHGGSLEFLGDRFANRIVVGPGVLKVALCVIAVLLLVGMVRYGPLSQPT